MRGGAPEISLQVQITGRFFLYDSLPQVIPGFICAAAQLEGAGARGVLTNLHLTPDPRPVARDTQERDSQTSFSSALSHLLSENPHVPLASPYLECPSNPPLSLARYGNPVII